MIKKLLKDNLEDMRNGIDLNDLSKTFLDALSVTRMLQQRYIWIDSLCIIQDDGDDWTKESSYMNEIYLRSLCNVCATAASDGSEGLFVTRQPRSMKSLKLDLGNGYPLYLFDDNMWRQNLIDRAPLNTRAWVCQERILSPCNIHFAKDQIFWEV